MKMKQYCGGDMKMFSAHKTAIIESSHIMGGTKIWAYSHICPMVSIGENCVIGEGVYIGPRVIIGDNVRIQNHALIYEGVEIEDDVMIGPNVVTTNDYFPVNASHEEWKENRFRKTIIKRGASIGANCTILCGVTIAEQSLIGCGSVVIKDTEPGCLYVGNPARKIREII